LVKFEKEVLQSTFFKETSFDFIGRSASFQDTSFLGSIFAENDLFLNWSQ